MWPEPSRRSSSSTVVADLTGATVETIVAIRGDVGVDGSSRGLGDIMTLDATTSVDPAASVVGQVRDLAPDIAGIGLVLGPALVLLYVGVWRWPRSPPRSCWPAWPHVRCEAPRPSSAANPS